MTIAHAASAAVEQRLQRAFTFQLSVDVTTVAQGLMVGAAAVAAGITIVEMGTPLIKCEGAANVVPAFRKAFPDTLLLADMKTMDGSVPEARTVFGGGGNVVDFLALAGAATARSLCVIRDEFRAADPTTPRLVFADVMLPHQADRAADIAEQMLETGCDGVGIHLHADSRRADPSLWHGTLLRDAAQAVFERVGKRASVQVVGGLSIEQAKALARDGLRAFVISGNFGFPDLTPRFDLPPAELTARVATFIREVSAA
jgi:3-keto-L-gulonate-6-phosphate decarboxylase